MSTGATPFLKQPLFAVVHLEGGILEDLHLAPTQEAAEAYLRRVIDLSGGAGAFEEEGECKIVSFDEHGIGTDVVNLRDADEVAAFVGGKGGPEID